MQRFRLFLGEPVPGPGDDEAGTSAASWRIAICGNGPAPFSPPMAGTGMASLPASPHALDSAMSCRTEAKCMQPPRSAPGFRRWRT